MHDVVFLMRNGFTLDQACDLDPILRSAFIYIIQLQHGAQIEWKTGRVLPPDAPPPQEPNIPIPRVNRPESLMIS